MNAILAALVAILLFATPLFAAELGAPTLSAPLAASRFFDPDRLLTTGGVKAAAGELTLEPEWGVGYHSMERELPGGIAESTHRVHAQAGWRLSLSDTLYFSAAAKLPVLTFESSDRQSGQSLDTRLGYDFARPFRNPLTWTGELGLRLSSWSDLSLYYDKESVSGMLSAGRRQEERVGTRINLKFW